MVDAHCVDNVDAADGTAVVAGVHDWDEIEAAVLAETRGPCQYASASHQLLQTIAPGVTLRVVHCEPAGDAGR